MTAQGNALGHRHPIIQALKGRTNQFPAYRFQMTENNGKGQLPISFGTPFQGSVGVGTKPRALPWAGIGMPRWGSKAEPGDPAVDARGGLEWRYPVGVQSSACEWGGANWVVTLGHDGRCCMTINGGRRVSTNGGHRTTTPEIVVLVPTVPIVRPPTIGVVLAPMVAIT